MNDGELCFQPVTVLAEEIRAGRVSSSEVVEACLHRIAEVNPLINAVVRLADDATDAARLADADLRAGTLRGPLHGVPFTIKDSLDTAGLITTAGSIGWSDRVPERDATVVARLRAAGGILLGKTNTPEFTWSDETDNLVFGRTSNPYDVSRTPGGSSGGAGAIVAAGGSPFDIGSDTGDSIRQPAHVCGIAGLKPTSGRVPRTGHSPGFGGILESLTQLGPMARRVDDLALLLPIIAGPDGEDPHVPPVPLGRPADVAVAGLRVAFFTDNGVRTPTPETIAAVVDAARAIEATGARVEENVPPDMGEVFDLWDRLIRADGYAWLKRLISTAGTPGLGSYASADWITADDPLPGDALTALVERRGCRPRPDAPVDRRHRSCRLPGNAAAGDPPRRQLGVMVRRYVQRRPQPHGLAQRRRPRRDVAGRSANRRAACRAAMARGRRARRGDGRRAGVGRLAASADLTAPRTGWERSVSAGSRRRRHPGRCARGRLADHRTAPTGPTPSPQ